MLGSSGGGSGTNAGGSGLAACTGGGGSAGDGGNGGTAGGVGRRLRSTVWPVAGAAGRNALPQRSQNAAPGSLVAPQTAHSMAIPSPVDRRHAMIPGKSTARAHALADAADPCSVV